MSSTEASFLDSLVSAVGENPLAAALIGGGALWLLVGNDKLNAVASSAKAAASPIADIGARNLRSAASALERTAAPPTAPEMDHSESFGETAHEGRRAASHATAGAADTIKNRFDEGVGYARENLSILANPLPAKTALAKAQSSLADVLERQPLILGAIGLAIGAAVAGAFRTSNFENELVGPLSDNLKADLNMRAGSVSQTVREASETLKTELSDIGSEAVDRVKQAGRDAVDAAQETVKSP